MGLIREPKRNETKLERLSQITDLRSALELMVDLQENHTFQEEQKVSKYNSKTGKPEKYSWKTYEKFGTDFTFGGDGFGEDVKVELHENVIKEIKKGPVCFDLNDKKYIAKFETIDHSGDGNSCVEYSVYLSQARII